MHIFPTNCTIKFFIKTNFTFALSAFSIEISEVLVPYHFSFLLIWIEFILGLKRAWCYKKGDKRRHTEKQIKNSPYLKVLLTSGLRAVQTTRKKKKNLICHLTVTSANLVHNWGISLSHLLITSSSKVGSLSRVFLVWVLGICVFIFYFNGDSLPTRMSSYYKVGVKKRRR